MHRSHRHLGAGALLAVIFMAGCTQQPAVGVAAKGKSLTPGVNVTEDSVDGLIVGHRLMEAGEYELALRAYYRAAGDEGLTTDVLSAVGSANLKLGRIGQAEKILRRAVKLDEDFAPAWNNLGVVLMEQNRFGEAERVFRTAFALDSGESADIKKNLSLALAKLEFPSYDTTETETFALLRRGTGDYQLLATP